jgi:Helicase conserved C-terminal domain
MTTWLAQLGEDRLEQLLSRRPDATAGSAPRNLRQLAQRLAHPQLIAAVLDAAPTPLRQASEALLFLSDPRTEAELRELLEDSGSDHDAAVAGTLEHLYDRAIAWPGADGSIGLAAGLTQMFPQPLGLGPSLRSVVDQMTGDSLRRALRDLDEPRPPARREDAANALLRRLADPAAVRAIVAAAPGSIPRQLHAIALESLGVEGAGPDDNAYDTAPGDHPDDDFSLDNYRRNRYARDAYPDDYQRNSYAHDDDALEAVNSNVYELRYGRFAQRNQAMRWAIERGLMHGATFGPGPFMPAEIAVALRGTTIHAPFTPYPPPIPSTVVDPATVDSGAAAAAADFAGQAVAVLDLVARAPLPQLKSGGVGARELARVAKAAAIDESAARLVIELAAELGLLALDGGFLRATAAYSPWRELEPAAAYSALLETWLAMSFNPTESTDREGRTTRLLQRSGNLHDAPAAREVLFTVLASLPPGRSTTRAEVAPALVWSRPRVGYVPQDATKPYATVWAEAERLGVVAAGALSPIGRAIDDRDGNRLATLLQAMLPANTDSARFGSDLTVLVSGSPSAKVSGLLDRTADRESRGAGVTWRFSPASVRRALDDGADAGDLLADLEAIAIGELPQPLHYLINDVARRHGELQVSAALSVIRGEDPALLARTAADRGLRGLGLRLVAPTVATSAKSESDTLLALRAAGYLPVPEPRDGPAGTAPASAAASRIPPRPPPNRSPAGPHSLRPDRKNPRRPAAGTVVSLRALAAHLLAHHAVDDVVAVGGADAVLTADAADTDTEVVLGRLNPRLTDDEVHQLAYAVETGGSVTITYESTSGALTQRVIGGAKLGGGMLDAWCYLRDDERFFLVDRILSVAPGSA